jgi:bacterial/archaeal transporter family protein
MTEMRSSRTNLGGGVGCEPDGAIDQRTSPVRLSPSVTWLPYALVSAVAAAATAILAKIGIQGVPSNLATAIRTVVILIFAWAIAIGGGQHHALGRITGRSLLFLGLSGIATGISWLAYFRALQLGPASRVAPIDKLSLALTLVLAAVFLHETVTWKVALGVALMVAGALLTILG